MMKLLLKSGIVRRNDDGTLRWPIHVCPLWIWKVQLRVLLSGEDSYITPFGVFRNLPWVIRDVGTWLPRRWGFHILGLEIGQRG